MCYAHSNDEAKRRAVQSLTSDLTSDVTSEEMSSDKTAAIVPRKA